MIETEDKAKIEIEKKLAALKTLVSEFQASIEEYVNENTEVDWFLENDYFLALMDAIVVMTQSASILVHRIDRPV